jgi:hypothetical protein
MQTSGDSIITEMGPFESLLQKGVQVTTNSVMRLQDGKLWGPRWHTMRRPAPTRCGTCAWKARGSRSTAEGRGIPRSSVVG